MGDGAVVALEEVLAGDLPVRLETRLGAEAEHERVDVEQLGELRGHVTERVRERWCIGVRVDEDERAPRIDLDLHQAELGRLEAGLAVRPRRRAQRPVEVVRPRVVRALQRRARPRPRGNDVTPVPADVEEGAELSVSRARDHDGDLPRRGREEASVLRDLAGVTDVLPGAREDALVLAAKHLGVGVPAPRKRPFHVLEL